MWIDNGASKGTEDYKETVKAVKEFCAKMEGSWAAKIEVCSKDANYNTVYWPAKFELVLLDCEKEGKIDWGYGAEVIVRVDYDNYDVSKTAYEFQTYFVVGDSADGVKALELMIVALNAWVEEECFPNATLTVDPQDLVLRKEIQGYLCEHGFNGYIISKAKRSKFKQ